MFTIGSPDPIPTISESEAITEQALLPYRQKGDPLADETIAAIFAAGDLKAVHGLLKHLVQNDHALVDDPESDEEKLSPHVLEKVQVFFDQSDKELSGFDPELIKEGEKVFASHGPEILLLLATYSLPASYTAKRGAQVLAQTGRLESEPYRRLIETTQMVIDVMAPGGLSLGQSAVNHGKGIRTAQKVRLMHAAIRRLIVERDGQKFVADFGVPINQMDLCGTLMTFTSVIFDGLEMLRVKLTPREQEAYLYAWRAVGSIIGVEDCLIPKTAQRADEFKRVIRESEIGKCQAGIELTSALVGCFEDRIEPRFLKKLPVAFMRRLLGQYAEVIEVPKAGWTGGIVTVFVTLSGWLDALHRSIALTAWIHRKVSHVLIDSFLRMERGGNRSSFDIPDELAGGWKMKGS